MTQNTIALCILSVLGIVYVTADNGLGAAYCQGCWSQGKCYRGDAVWRARKGEFLFEYRCDYVNYGFIQAFSTSIINGYCLIDGNFREGGTQVFDEKKCAMVQCIKKNQNNSIQMSVTSIQQGCKANGQCYRHTQVYNIGCEKYVCIVTGPMWSTRYIGRLC